jgi:isopenicillin-N N-acyltransferase like protein
MTSAGAGSAPVVWLSGGPRARGRGHGEALREQIATRLERARADLALGRGTDLARLDRDLGSLLDRTRFVAAIARWVPGLLTEIEGIAEGAGISRLDALTLNLMDELAWLQAGGEVDDSCSSLAIPAPGGWLAGQTMDLEGGYDGSQAILRIEQEHGDALVLTSAGMVGLCGLNRDSVAIFCNQLMSLRTSTSGLPVAAVVRGALARPSFASAREFLGGIEHASGQNYLLAGPERALNLECSAGGVRECAAGGEAIWHTNHPLAGGDVDPAGEGRSGFSTNSAERFAFLSMRVPGARSREDLQAILSDRSVPICKVPGPDGRQLTFGALVVELSNPPRAWIAPGPSDHTAWAEFDLSEPEPAR